MTGRVLLTGGSGLIGRQVVPHLIEAGFEIVALGHREPVAGAHESLSVDLLDAGTWAGAVADAGASHLLHLAWHGTGKDLWGAPQNIDWTAATLRLVREFASAGGQRVVCAGSCAEYDWSHEVLSEATPLRPFSLYGKANAAAGDLLVAAATHIGLSLAWARVFFSYGPGEPRGRLLGDLISGLAAGKPVDCTDGHQERDFLHASDVAGALVAILTSDLNGPVNVASGVAVPVRRLIETTADIFDRRDLVRLGARPRPPSDPARIVGDVRRLATTGFTPRYSLEAGLRQCVEAWHASQKAPDAEMLR